MLILTCPSQLQRLEVALRRSLPLALPVHGAVMNINRGNPGEFEVAVDSWPDFGAVLARRSGEVAGGDSFFLGGGGDTHDTRTHSASGNNPWVAPQMPLDDCYRNMHAAFYRDLTAAPLFRLDPGVRVGSLDPSHADLLNETWAYGGNERSRRYLAEVLGRFPSVCLQDEERRPFSWVLRDPYGTGAQGYTLPTHRRRGYMKTVLILAARRDHALGFPIFG
ncbi:GLYL3 protein, partial [Trogon melanurus]|nr:GLYL3 protein [Trogon melanurus]